MRQNERSIRSQVVWPPYLSRHSRLELTYLSILKQSSFRQEKTQRTGLNHRARAAVQELRRLSSHPRPAPSCPLNPTRSGIHWEKMLLKVSFLRDLSSREQPQHPTLHPRVEWFYHSTQ